MAISPGADFAMVTKNSIVNGRTAGLYTSFGIGLAIWIHVGYSLAGLALIISKSILLFSLIKYLGAAYLIYLGIRALLTRNSNAVVDVPTPRSLYRLFTDGVVVSVLNPKIAVFFLAFLPQFVEPSRGPAPQQVLFLGLLYVALALITDGAYAFLASRLRRWLGSHVIQGPLPQYASGGVYLGLGVSMALADRQ